MKRISLTVLLLALIGTVGAAQSKTYSEDLGLTIGINVPMYDGIESDATVGIMYGRFNNNGFGFRAGFQYTPSVAEVDNSYGIPIAIAYRTASRSNSDRLTSGLNAAASTAVWDTFYDNRNIAGDMFRSFLMSTISNVELYAGVTPSYIKGDSSTVETAWYADNTWEKEWTELNGKIALTLDAGFSINYSIWRFDLKLMPAFHYNLTNNFIDHKTTGYSDITVSSDRSEPIRWFFSFAGGLSFRF